MAKRKVVWTRKAVNEMLDIMNYYAKRNKSRIYSNKLQIEIKQLLKSIDFSIALPQKTAVQDVFYFTHKHNSVFFYLIKNDIEVLSVWDERQNPQSLESFLKELF